MGWIDHTPDCWTDTPPDNSHATNGANPGLRWLLPPHNGRYQPAPVIAFLNYNACAGVDNWSCEKFPDALQSRGIHFSGCGG